MKDYPKLELEYEIYLENCTDEEFDKEIIKAEIMFRTLFGWMKKRKGIKDTTT